MEGKRLQESNDNPRKPTSIDGRPRTLAYALHGRPVSDIRHQRGGDQRPRQASVPRAAGNPRVPSPNTPDRPAGVSNGGRHNVLVKKAQNAGWNVEWLPEHDANVEEARPRLALIRVDQATALGKNGCGSQWGG